jgi:hypothetical protein
MTIVLFGVAKLGDFNELAKYFFITKSLGFGIGPIAVDEVV